MGHTKKENWLRNFVNKCKCVALDSRFVLTVTEMEHLAESCFAELGE
jgi:hypothetical protein